MNSFSIETGQAVATRKQKILGPLSKEKIEKGNFVGSINVSQLSKASNREQQVLFLIELHAFKLYEGPLSILFPWRVIENFIFPWFVILGINPFYVRVNLNFDFFVNVKSCFEFPVMREKAK